MRLKASRFDSNEGKLTVGNSHTIKATVAPEEVAAETTIEWSSSNEKVATVDSNGKVTAVSSGNATITATAGEESANYEVTVEQPKKVTTSNKTYKSSGSSNSAAAVTPTNPAPVTPVTPSAPATPVQPSNPEPAAPSSAKRGAYRVSETKIGCGAPELEAKRRSAVVVRWVPCEPTTGHRPFCHAQRSRIF